jgi:tetratricopeptide (TPR) repeat protein
MSERPTTAALLQQGLFHHRQGQISLAMERYTEALRDDPENAEALYYVAVVACQQGDLETGIDLARRSLSFNIRQPRAHNVLGQALQRQKHYDEALACYDKALEYDPNFVDALANRANLLGETGRHAQAVAAYDKVLALRPGLPQDWCNRGQSLHAIGQLAEAIASYDRALATEPKFALAHNNRADVLRAVGRMEAALDGYTRATQLRPDFAEAHAHRGSILAALGRFDDALAAYDRALAKQPELAGAWLGRANAAFELGQHSEALTAYDKALALKSDFVEALVGRVHVCNALERFSDALEASDRALSLRPDLAEARLGRGIALANMGSHADALASFAQALALQPDMPHALYQTGIVQLECGELAQARANLERAALLAPDDDEIAFSLSQIQLLQGDWEQGFANFERRSNPRRPAYTPLPWPRWSGEPPGDYRLVLLTEQGLGDIVQFSRYATLLASRGYPVALLAHEDMALLLRGLDGVEIVASPEELARDPRPVRWLPLMSVMQQLHLTPESIPAQAPYLAADGARAAAWRERLGSAAFRIGIAWQGRMEGRRAARAAPLSAFAPLAEIPGVRLISLQKTPGSVQIADVAFGDRIEQPLSDTDFSRDALPDIAAVIANLDLVVSIDTMSAHLAGALGRPVFVALRRVADWRWLLDRDDSPWYPSMRLFRQSREGEWGEVFSRIAATARDMLNGPT